MNKYPVFILSAAYPAYDLAAELHAGKTYLTPEGPKPYLDYHLLKVAAHFVSDPVRQIIALLHDAPEDCGYSLVKARIEFGPRVADALDALTRRHNEPYLSEYMERVILNEDAMFVKDADLTENIKGCEAFLPEEQKSRRARYFKAKGIIGRDMWAKE